MTHFVVFALALILGVPQDDIPDPTTPVVAQVIVDAPTGAVWDAWTTRDLLLAWNEIGNSAMDLKIGGSWRTSYDPDSNLDDDTVIESTILAFDPGRMLATRTVRAPADFPFPNAILETWAVLYLEPVSDTQTRITTRMFGFTQDEESQGMREFFEWGNQYELDKLAAYFAEDGP